MSPAERRPGPRPAVDRSGAAEEEPVAPTRAAPADGDPAGADDARGAERRADGPRARPQQRHRTPQPRRASEARAPRGASSADQGSQGQDARGQESRAQGPRGQGHRGQRSSGRTVEETSAGGLVVRHVDGVPHVAVIARINRGGRLEWCLPKGHLEGAETAEQAAVREIAEETGIEGRVLQALGSIDYWFSVEGRRIHKTVHHYLLEATGGTLGVEGDPDAEAVDAAWVPVPELPERLAFSNERRIARMAGSILAEGA